tara:strand:- start:6005 stop:7561 length:1557 start_codon:yes stop_codon:yes gene_type:complete
MEKNIFKIKAEKLLNQYNVGNLRYVIEQSQVLLKKFPNNPFLYNLIGSSLQKMGNFELALDKFLHVVQIDKNNTAAYNNLGNVFKTLKKFDEAKKNYEKALNIDPKFVNALVNIGNLHFEMNDYEKAIANLEEAIRINPNIAQAHYNLGIVYQSLGEFEKSKKHMEQVLLIDPKNTNADKILSRYTKYTVNNPHIQKMEKKILELDLSDYLKSNLNFALGKAYEDTEDYEKSFFNIKLGNDIKKKLSQYDVEKDIKTLKQTKKIFEENSFNINKTLQKKEMIFIVGMPRSGTSLIEQIISAHSLVYGCGELDFLNRIVKKEFFTDNIINTVKFKNLNHQKIENLSNDYLNFVQKFEPKSLKYTDKAPLNFIWIGFIKILFPNSKIIHCVREAKDNILSLYKNSFDEHLNFTYNLNDLFDFYKEYLDLMNFWKKKFPDSIYDAIYENIIHEPQKEIQKILKYCELEYEESCIKFYDNKRLIKTVSSSQARKPIYNSSVSSYKNYEKYLKNTFSKLDMLK